MRRFATLALLLGLLAPAAIAESVAGAGTDSPSAYVPGRLLVKFKAAAFGPARGPQTSYRLPSAAQTALATVNGRVDRAYAGIGWVRVVTDRPVPEAVAALQASGAVDYAEPDARVHAFATPSDPRFGEQWALLNSGQGGGTAGADIEATVAWDTRTTAQNVIVGVVDTGIDYTHPDLQGNMWVNPGEIPENGLDDDGNGYIDDVHGINAMVDDPQSPLIGDPMDDAGHGTHVAGTIGARGDNGRGIAGVAWRARLMALKFLSADGGATSDAIETIEYAVAMKQALGYSRLLLNNSWGGLLYEQSLRDAIGLARDAGILFIAAAGNNGAWNDYRFPVYPASYDLDNLVRVGATDRDDRPAKFSNRGCYTVDLFAPGVDILSTLPGTEKYGSMSGTSMAAPHVAGAAALIWAAYPLKDWRAIKRALLNGAERNPHLLELASSQARLNLRNGLMPANMNRPSIWGITPTDPALGTQITLSGSQFGSTPGSLTLQGQAVPVDSWSDTRIQATLPMSLGTGYGQLRVITAKGLKNGNGACIQVGNKAGRTSRVSIDSHGFQGDKNSSMPDMSASGRYVVFQSMATDLVSNDENGRVDVFLHDRHAGTTQRISQGYDGEANSDSYSPAISADGRYIAFYSSASNLVPDDLNNTHDVFLHDRLTGVTTRVDVAADGSEADRGATAPSISADGRYVAFISQSTNLIAGGTDGTHQAYVRDTRLHQTIPASVNNAGGLGNDGSYLAMLSTDGRKLAFVSAATNLVSGDSNGANDVFLRLLASGKTSRVSLSSTGIQANDWSTMPALSGDGSLVAFASIASNLVENDGNATTDVFMRDRSAKETTRLSVSFTGQEGNAASQGFPRFSPDGGSVVLFSNADNLVALDLNEVADNFVRDLNTGRIERVNVAGDGSEANAAGIFMITRHGISADGRFIAFLSSASNLVSGDSNAAGDIFVRDREQLPTGRSDIVLTTAPTLTCQKGVKCKLSLTIENQGPDESPVRLIQVYPPGFGYTPPLSGGACSWLGSVSVCNLHNLAPAASISLNLFLNADLDGRFQTTLTALGLRQDDNLTDNEREIAIQVAP